ncbi:hypothetical protein E0Z10_g2206, partial [Xylaria hypoxylon]
PFDHPHVWDGNATLVDELAALEAKGFFGENGGAVDAIVCNVGGGGLLNGIMEGIERNYGLSPAPGKRPAVLALETAGADSLAASIRLGTHTTIPGITSIATSLGAPRVSEKTYQWAETCNAGTFTFPSAPSTKPVRRNPNTTHLVSAVVSDAVAVSACARFLDDARLLVEVACGATLSSAYNSQALLRAALAPDTPDEIWAKTNIVLVVCGGSNISMDLLAKYREKFGV